MARRLFVVCVGEEVADDDDMMRLLVVVCVVAEAMCGGQKISIESENWSPPTSKLAVSID
jgi:hypothetical protein